MLPVALALLILLGAPASASQYEQQLRLVVAVKSATTPSAGSGVLVGANQVVTSLHILGEGEHAWVLFRGDRLVRAVVVMRDGAHDLALLRLENDLPHPVARLNRKAVDVGQTISMVGHPNGHMWSLSLGYVMSADLRTIVFGVGDVAKVIQADVSAFGGSSGGGVFNGAGELIGIAKGRLDETSITYFVPAAALCKHILKC